MKPAADYLGGTQIMFETDFPTRPACYPRSIERAQKTGSARSDPEVQKMVLQDNAARLYGIDLD